MVSYDTGGAINRRINSGEIPDVVVTQRTSVNELVKAGSGAILIVRDGPVALTADVIARTGGGLGESVTVYNAQTRKLLSGTVIGPDRVELVLPGGEPE